MTIKLPSRTIDEIKVVCRVLFIDDQKFNTVEILKKSGWRVTRVKDIESIDSTEVRDCHIIFVDIRGVGRAMKFNDEGDAIPNDFDSNKFLQLVKDKIPEDYYGALKKYNLNVLPKGSYYLLKANDEKKLILFDYSCTTEIDGPVLLDTGKYDLDHLEFYDKCK